MNLLARTRTHADAARILGFSSILATLVLALALSADPPGAAGEETPTDPTTTFDRTFTYIGEQEYIQFDIGVRNVDVVAIGAPGADIASRVGGLGAKVRARVPIEPEGGGFYVLVGGNGGEGTLGAQEGGFNGGGDGNKPSWTSVRGGGGGGATDIRTINSYDLDTLASRVLVAGGGGGAGGNSVRGGWLGGVGGNAGQSGARGANATPQNTVGSGGFGGAPGTQSAGGAGGDGGFVYPNGSSTDGHDGGPGQLGRGGPGGSGATNSGSAMGAGGGGGYYGGGGGGGGLFDFFEQEYFSGGGGGGGGSSLVPDGGTSSVASSEDVPSVEISYTQPGTTIISGPAARTDATEAEFAFSSSEPDSTFECRLDQAGDFTSCDSSVVVEDLTEGDHVFKVRAINEMGNLDDTPAEWSFTVDTTAPTATIGSGPTGKTKDRRPEFTFSSSESGTKFECRFDQEAFRACSGATSDRPATDLTIGTHTFAVKAIDQAGNTGPDATRSFEIEAGDPTPPPPPPPPVTRLQLKQPQLNRAKGIALLPATVSGPGKVLLLKSKSVRASQRKPGKAKTVKLKVVARGKALKRLRRRGKVKVTVRVRFTPTAGKAVTKVKKLTLKKKKKKSRRR